MVHMCSIFIVHNSGVRGNLGPKYTGLMNHNDPAALIVFFGHILWRTYIFRVIRTYLVAYILYLPVTTGHNNTLVIKISVTFAAVSGL